MTVPTLRDDRVCVRALEERDIDAYLAAFADDDELLDRLGYEDVPERDELTRWFAERWVDPPELREWEFAVAGVADDRFLGTVMLHSCSWWHRRGELGAWTVPEARGVGANSAAVRLLLGWAFNDLGLERIEITTLPDNPAAVHLAGKLGFTYEGTLRQRNFERGRRVDLQMWSLLADEWLAGDGR